MLSKFNSTKTQSSVPNWTWCRPLAAEACADAATMVAAAAAFSQAELLSLILPAAAATTLWLGSNEDDSGADDIDPSTDATDPSPPLERSGCC
jgi:hypothetical protein